MNLSEYKNNWALVTGASSGIGKEFCIQLAAIGMNLVMVARRKDRLEQLASELMARNNIKVFVFGMDLSQCLNEPLYINQLRAQLEQNNICIRLLCNNAGSGRLGRFEEKSLSDHIRTINLNSITAVSLCHLFLPHLSSFTSSVIINVSSPAAFQPMPYFAVYAATKAFLHSFSEALHGEWKDRGIVVQTLVPGPTDTEIDQDGGMERILFPKRDLPANVVRISLKNIDENKPLVVIAKGTYKQRIFATLFPAKMVIREVGKMLRPR